MPNTVIVKLSDPFEHHNETITQVEIREPSGGLYARLGEPRILVRNAAGFYFVEQTPIIHSYLDKCIVHQDGSTLLGLMSLRDVMQLKETLFGFFSAAEASIMKERALSSASA